MRRIAMLAFVATFVAAAAFAQERAGAGRFDVTLAPVGGVYFTDSSTKGEPSFKDSAVMGAMSFHLNNWFALEGEFSHAQGFRQDITRGDGSILNSQSSPSIYGYTANVLFYPQGDQRELAMYFVGGGGGITLRGTDKVRPLGINKNETFLTADVGGGVKWFAGRHWGIRSEYRLIGVKDKSTAPEFFGREEVRLGHRIYAGLLLNY